MAIAGLAALGVAVPGFKASPRTVLRLWCPVQVLLGLVLALSSVVYEGPLPALAFAVATICHLLVFVGAIGAGALPVLELAILGAVLTIVGSVAIPDLSGLGTLMLGGPAVLVALLARSLPPSKARRTR